jgi:hypothetical protein
MLVSGVARSRWSRQALEEKAQNGYFRGADFVKCAEGKKGDVTHTTNAVRGAPARSYSLCGGTRRACGGIDQPGSASKHTQESLVVVSSFVPRGDGGEYCASSLPQPKKFLERLAPRPPRCVRKWRPCSTRFAPTSSPAENYNSREQTSAHQPRGVSLMALPAAKTGPAADVPRGDGFGYLPFPVCLSMRQNMRLGINFF